MQFKVPQFLEIEDKIFGPFTFKQFVYLVGGGGLCYMFFRMLGLFWGAIPILLVGGFAAALTFYRPNGKPFIYLVEAGVKYFTQSKLYIWKKRMVERKAEEQKAVMAAAEIKKQALGLATPGEKLSGSKLRDLAWSLDILDMKKGENN